MSNRKPEEKPPNIDDSSLIPPDWEAEDRERARERKAAKKKKKLMGQMVQVVFRVPAEIDSAVQKIAEAECRSYSSVLRQAVTEWLKSRRRKP